MTRINFGIPVRKLTDKHLLAEHREIKRIPNAITNGIAKFNYDFSDIPKHFSLGKGHVRFFYNKILYLHKRYLKLHDECLRRKFKVTFYNDCFTIIMIKHPSLYNNATPRVCDRKLVEARIAERLNNKPQKFNSSTKGDKQYLGGFKPQKNQSYLGGFKP